MLETILQDTAVFLGALHLLSPIVARSTMRFAARCNPVELSLEDLPPKLAAIFRPRVAELGNLGFELLGCYDCGSLTSETRSLAAYFCNRTTNEFANVSVMVTPKTAVSYFEFSARFANGLILETNTNGRIPLTPENPELRIFRFPKIQTPQALYRVHRQLEEKYAPGLWPQGEPKGEELHRFLRVMNNYGPRHVRIGYMTLTNNGQSYKFTWKGACLITWRGLWPTSLFRRVLQRHAMQSELDSLEVRGMTALQKA
jgi:hypothetical protein